MYELSWKESTDHFDRHHFFFFSTYIQCTNNFCIDQTFDDVTHTHIHENDRIFAALHFHSWLPTKQLKEDYHVRVTERVDNAKNDTGQKKKKHKKSAVLHSMQTIQSRMLCRVDKFMAISPLVVFRYLLLLLYFHFFAMQFLFIISIRANTICYTSVEMKAFDASRVERSEWEIPNVSHVIHISIERNIFFL